MIGGEHMQQGKRFLDTGGGIQEHMLGREETLLSRPSRKSKP